MAKHKSLMKCMISHRRRNNTRRYSILEEIDITQVQLPQFVLLLRRRLVRESGDGHAHARGADEARDKDEQVGMFPGQFVSYFLGDGHK
jgi:hypothetical protein